MQVKSNRESPGSSSADQPQTETPSRLGTAAQWLGVFVLSVFALAFGLNFGLLTVVPMLVGSVPVGTALVLVCTIVVAVAVRRAGASWLRTVAVVALWLISFGIGFRLIVPTLVTTSSVWYFVPAFSVFGIVAFGLISRIGRVGWLLPAGTIALLAPVVALAANPQDGDPDAKPEPFNGEVEHWSLATGSRIGYVHFPAVGPAAGPPVIFVHGGPGGGATAADFAFGEGLAERGFETYVYDQAGVGYSDDLRADEYSIQRMVDDLEAIRAEIGTETVNLIGHSWGGTLVAHYLTENSDHVHRAVLQSPASYGKPSPVTDPNLTASDGAGQLEGVTGQYRVRFLGFLLQYQSDANPEMWESILSQPQAKQLVAENLDVSKLGLGGRCANVEPSEPIPGSAEMFAAANFNLYPNRLINSELQKTDRTEGLSNITTPVLVVRGVCDFIQWADQRDYRDHIPDAAMVVIPDEGHSRGPGAADATLSFLLEGDPGRPTYTDDEIPQR